MNDPIAHDDLTTLSNRRDVYRLTALLSRVVEGEPAIAALTAAALLLLSMCELEDVDVDDLLAQVAEADDMSDLCVTPDDVSDIDAQLLFTH